MMWVLWAGLILVVSAADYDIDDPGRPDDDPMPTIVPYTKYDVPEIITDGAISPIPVRTLSDSELMEVKDALKLILPNLEDLTLPPRDDLTFPAVYDVPISAEEEQTKQKFITRTQSVTTTTFIEYDIKEDASQDSAHTVYGDDNDAKIISDLEVTNTKRSSNIEQAQHDATRTRAKISRTQGNDTQKQTNDSPKRTNATRKRINNAPKQTNDSPKRTNATRRRINAAPKRTNATRNRINAAPERTNASRFEYTINLTRTTTISQVSDLNKEATRSSWHIQLKDDEKIGKKSALTPPHLNSDLKKAFYKISPENISIVPNTETNTPTPEGTEADFDDDNLIKLHSTVVYDDKQALSIDDSSLKGKMSDRQDLRVEKEDIIYKENILDNNTINKAEYKIIINETSQLDLKHTDDTSSSKAITNRSTQIVYVDLEETGVTGLSSIAFKADSNALDYDGIHEYKETTTTLIVQGTGAPGVDEQVTEADYDYSEETEKTSGSPETGLAIEEATETEAKEGTRAGNIPEETLQKEIKATKTRRKYSHKDQVFDMRGFREQHRKEKLEKAQQKTEDSAIQSLMKDYGIDSDSSDNEADKSGYVPILRQQKGKGKGKAKPRPTTKRKKRRKSTPGRLDIPILLEYIKNLTSDYSIDLANMLNRSLQRYTLPTCGLPTTTTPETTTSTPTTTTLKYGNLTGTVMGKCFVCGLEEIEMPVNSDCSDAFAADVIPLLPVNPTSRANIANYKKYCRWMNIPRYYINYSDPRTFWGRWTGGCSVRWIDLTGMYTQRTCRNRHSAILGRHWISKRMARLEMALQAVDNGCIISPMASLVPLSRGISLYARFHACVCTGNWCNLASIRLQWTPFTAIFTLLLHLSIYL